MALSVLLDYIVRRYIDHVETQQRGNSTKTAQVLESSEFSAETGALDVADIRAQAGAVAIDRQHTDPSET